MNTTEDIAGEYRRLFKLAQGANPDTLVCIAWIWDAIHKGHLSIGEAWAALSAGPVGLQELLSELRGIEVDGRIDYNQSASIAELLEQGNI